MNLISILSNKVSFQINAWSPLTKEMTITEVLNEIKQEKLKTPIEKLREVFNANELDIYKREKQRLPAVTFCASFDLLRQKENLKIYNSIIVVDIDKLNLVELNRVKEILLNDKFTFAYWNSPSNLGVKGLVYIEFTFTIENNSIDKIHKSAFDKLKNYFFDEYSIVLDSSGSDTTRLCFLSSDKNLILKDDITSFKLSASEIQTVNLVTKTKNIKDLIIKKGSYNPIGKNKNTDRQSIKLLINYLTKKQLSITDNYEKWYKIAYAISNSFTPELGERYYLQLCQLDGRNHNEMESKNMLRYCYQNNNGAIKYQTIEFYAKEKGYDKSLRGGVYRNKV